MNRAVVLFGHGTVEQLDDLSGFVTNIRRGHVPPPELVAELRHRYEVIGGHSPFNDIARELAEAVGREIGVPTTIAMRLWHPYARDVLADLASKGIEQAIFVPLAQHSGPVYAEAAQAACAELAAKGTRVDVRCVSNWGQVSGLLDAYAAAVRAGLEAIAAEKRAKTTTIFSAHSLPQSIVDAGDPYEREFRGSVEGVIARLGEASGVRPMVAFQSQGPAVGAGGRRMKWLGPDLPTTLDAVAARGDTHVLFAPIGFLADHVEILYDLDVEASELAKSRGLTTTRTASLNAAPALVAVIAKLARALLLEPS